MGNEIIFFCFGYSPDFSRNMLFFHPEILSRHSLETWAVSQEFLSAKQRLRGEQQCTLRCFTAGSASAACCFPAYAPRHQVASPGLTSTGKLSLETTGTS